MFYCDCLPEPDKLLVVTDTAVVALQARQEKRKGIISRPLHFFIDLRKCPIHRLGPGDIIRLNGLEKLI